jgi:hypothetical protein
MAIMNGDDQHNEIVQLEARIDELEATIESCRKFILAGANRCREWQCDSHPSVGRRNPNQSLCYGDLYRGGAWRHRSCWLEPQHRQGSYG